MFVPGRWVEWTAVRQHKHQQTLLQIQQAAQVLQHKLLVTTFHKWKHTTHVVKCQRQKYEKAINHHNKKLCKVALNALLLQR